jgi:DNA-directed RNA polymerase subunit RPC12/RpoP
LQTYLTGTLAGAGSFRCHSCGFHVALHALDEMPECPNCGERRFARASMFDVTEPDQPTVHGNEDAGWLDTVREELDESGQFLAFRDGERVSVLPLLSEWTRIGRSLTADIRLDDPTVSRRHALVCCQEDRVRVLDDRSLNGTCVNGERVEWHDLTDGDQLLIGRYHLYYLDTARVEAASPA